MADLQEKNKWETGIYQIEENDPVQGGSDGITNKPIKQLANRTKYLKNEVEKKYEEKPATTEEAGTVQLVDNLTTNDNTKALTAKQGFSLKGYIDSLTRNLSNCIPNSKKSSTVSSDSEDTIATSKAVKTAYEKAEAAKTLAESKQSPATTLAGYGITNFKVQDDLATANLNDITTAGIYGQPYDRQATTARNYPVNKAGSLIVKPSAYGVMQEYVVYDSKQYYCRNETRNGWGEWETIGADKAPINHTHRANQITDFETETTKIIKQLITYQKIGDFEIRKYPDGTMIQTFKRRIKDGEVYPWLTIREVTWAQAFIDKPMVSGWGGDEEEPTRSSNKSVDAGGTILVNILQYASTNAKLVYCLSEARSTTQEGCYIYFYAIGRYK